jgi:hypothetical protein
VSKATKNSIKGLVAFRCTGFHLDKEYKQTAEDNRGQHPLDGDRVNKIILAHPTIREHIGCPAQGPEAPKFCEADK